MIHSTLLVLVSDLPGRTHLLYRPEQIEKREINQQNIQADLWSFIKFLRNGQG